MSEPVRILVGDTIEQMRTLPAGCVHCCVTSPPYWGLRDYGVDGQIGLEGSPDEYVSKMVEVFREVRRCLRDDGTLWLNIGDSYTGNATSGGLGKQDTNCRIHGVPTKQGKPKDLCMIPWRVALALQADGWWLRSVIVWAKKSPMPESVTDRPTSSWEPIFLMAKSERYYYDAEAVKEPLTGAAVRRQSYGRNNQWGCIIDANQHADSRTHADAKSYAPDDGPQARNQRNVWHLGPEFYAEAHFATFPTEIPRRAIKAGTSEKGCCPKCGAPWERVVERKSMVIEPSGRDGRIPGNGQRSTSGKMVEPPTSRTLGWQPTCKCPAHDPVPCVVLDPFLGSGTTVAVARQLGRHGIGCELNPEYVELARVRIGKAERPHTFMDTRETDDAPLFGGVE